MYTAGIALSGKPRLRDDPAPPEIPAEFLLTDPLIMIQLWDGIRQVRHHYVDR